MRERTIPTIPREFKHGSRKFFENCDKFWINDDECIHNSHMDKHDNTHNFQTRIKDFISFKNCC